MDFLGESRIKVKVVSEKDHIRRIKTKRVLVKPEVIAEFYALSALSPDKEIIALLGGRIVGEYLEVQELKPIKSEGTLASVKPSPSEFLRVHDELLPQKLYVVGWAHSHPGHGIFLSPTDITTQKDYQANLSDSVVLVLDPFESGKISFRFFRVRDDKEAAVPYDLLVR